MYWPIGAPKVYALSKHELLDEHVLTSDDDAGCASPSNASGSPTLGIDGRPPSQPHTRRDDSNDAQVDRPEKPKEDDRAPAATKDNAPAVKLLGDGSQEGIVGLQVTRSGHVFATITRSALTIWQTKPTAVLASVERSNSSLRTYGPNVAILIRPDSAIFVVQTSLGYLITYSLAADPTARVYRERFADNVSGHGRRRSSGGYKGSAGEEGSVGPGEGVGVREISVRFRMVIRVDAGIGRALALDDELVVATEKPAAMQCIRWAPDSTGTQTSTELLSRMSWMGKKTSIVDMVHDPLMNLSTWVTNDGKAYAVQRLATDGSNNPKGKGLFRGYSFHVPETESDHAIKATINARFSLIAVACANGDIWIYTARDYAGHIPLSHKLQPSFTALSAGQLTFISYSPDGYCLFAGYENGWMTWSVFGKPCASSFVSDRALSESNREAWLGGIQDGFWIGSGSGILLLAPNDERIWVLEMARSAVAGCFSSANMARSLLLTSPGFMLYRGYDAPDLTTISAEAALWQHVQIPSAYLAYQWPIRSAVISSDGRYVAVAGRRGLAHYSVNSGRWKTFDDPLMENEFTVRGGLCWYQHILIAATESDSSYEVRLYSRELPLDNDRVMHVESLPAPIVTIARSGDDSLLTYTCENTLHHYIISVLDGSVRLVQVGQIALHGIIRAPPRVRAVSWILPEDQLDHGDPSQDVSVATVVFLVDGKLVLLHPSINGDGELKYEMRIIAHKVEYYTLMRDQSSFNSPMSDNDAPTSPSDSPISDRHHGDDLRDSLWFFDGTDTRVWMDVQDVLASASLELGRELPAAVKIPVDFYPLSILLNRGILFGVESDLAQRRDVNFSFLRFTTRTHLFLPALLRYHLSQCNSPAALHLSHYYQHLDYFPHALEMLLHDVLDEEVDSAPPREQALLPTVLSFLSAFPQYLDIVVQCTRKTEVRSWRTLFAYLPPPQELFEESLQRGSLKTAGGYLLVLHTLEELGSSSQQLIRLLGRARDEQDWELCKELARFLMALDESGGTLREALEMIELKSPAEERAGKGFFGTSAVHVRRSRSNGVGLGISAADGSAPRRGTSRSPASAASQPAGGAESPEDYFSAR